MDSLVQISWRALPARKTKSDPVFFFHQMPRAGIPFLFLVIEDCSSRLAVLSVPDAVLILAHAVMMKNLCTSGVDVFA